MSHFSAFFLEAWLKSQRTASDPIYPSIKTEESDERFLESGVKGVDYCVDRLKSVDYIMAICTYVRSMYVRMYVLYGYRVRVIIRYPYTKVFIALITK